jgi:nitrate reductase beta subunit
VQAKGIELVGRTGIARYPIDKTLNAEVWQVLNDRAIATPSHGVMRIYRVPPLSAVVVAICFVIPPITRLVDEV